MVKTYSKFLNDKMTLLLYIETPIVSGRYVGVKIVLGSDVFEKCNQ